MYQLSKICKIYVKYQSDNVKFVTVFSGNNAEGKLPIDLYTKNVTVCLNSTTVILSIDWNSRNSGNHFDF